jgi:photosystem II stability/assembly factor-like uncharacterized protein
MYVGTENGFNPLAHVGGRWRPSPPGLAGRPVVATAHPPDSPATIYAAVRGYGIYKTDDNGIRWKQILSTNAHSLLLDKTDSQRLWVGCEPAGVWRTYDGGQTWADLGETLQQLPSALDWRFPEPPYQPRLRALAQMPGRPETLLAGIEIGGLIRSDDGGTHWQPADGLDEDIHALAVDPIRADFWLASTGDGIYRSLDGGQSWAAAATGMPQLYAGPVIILSSGKAVTAATGTPAGHWVENAASTLYRSTDGAITWQSLDLAQPEYVTALAVDPISIRSIYVGTQSGRIYLSRDEGQTWEVMAELAAGVNAIMAARIG